MDLSRTHAVPEGDGPLYWLRAGVVAEHSPNLSEASRSHLAAVGDAGITFSLDKDHFGFSWITEAATQAREIMATGVNPLAVWTREAAVILFGAPAQTAELPALAAALVLKLGPAPLLPMPAFAPSLALPIIESPEDLPTPANLAELGMKAVLDVSYAHLLLTLAGYFFRGAAPDTLTAADLRLLKTRARSLLNVVRLADPALAAEAWRGALAAPPAPPADPDAPQSPTGLYL